MKHLLPILYHSHKIKCNISSGLCCNCFLARNPVEEAVYLNMHVRICINEAARLVGLMMAFLSLFSLFSRYKKYIIKKVLLFKINIKYLIKNKYKLIRVSMIKQYKRKCMGAQKSLPINNNTKSYSRTRNLLVLAPINARNVNNNYMQQRNYCTLATTSTKSCIKSIVAKLPLPYISKRFTGGGSGGGKKVGETVGKIAKDGMKTGENAAATTFPLNNTMKSPSTSATQEQKTTTSGQAQQINQNKNTNSTPPVMQDLKANVAATQKDKQAYEDKMHHATAIDRKNYLNFWEPVKGFKEKIRENTINVLNIKPTSPGEPLVSMNSQAASLNNNTITNTSDPNIMQNMFPTPKDPKLLMIEGSKPNNSNLISIAKSISSIIEEPCENLLACAGGLIPITQSFAANPEALTCTWKFLTLTETEMNMRHQPEIVKKIDALMQRNLVRLHGKNGIEGYRLNEAFRIRWARIFGNDYKQENIKFTAEELNFAINNFFPQLCLLGIDEKNALNSAFYLPLQNHFVLYNVINNKKIVWTFFTSEDFIMNRKISDNQPFGDDLIKKNRPQFLSIFVPQIVKDSDFTPIPETTIQEFKNFSSIAEIFSAIKDVFINDIVPKLQNISALPLYDGVGVTAYQIDMVIIEFEKEQKLLAEKLFKKDYKQYLNCPPTGENVDTWMKKKQKTSPNAYPYIVEMANKHNEKHGIQTRYDIPK